MIKDQLCRWLLPALSGSLPRPTTVQGWSLCQRPWCSVLDHGRCCSWCRQRRLVFINVPTASANCPLPTTHSHRFKETLMSATKVLSPLSAGTVLLTPWALSNPQEFQQTNCFSFYWLQLPESRTQLWTTCYVTGQLSNKRLNLKALFPLHLPSMSFS